MWKPSKMIWALALFASFSCLTPGQAFGSAQMGPWDSMSLPLAGNGGIGGLPSMTGQMGGFSPAVTGMPGAFPMAQQQMVDPFSAYANFMLALNWRGTQPLGLGSYMPPIGMDAIANSAIASQVTPWDFMQMQSMPGLMGGIPGGGLSPSPFGNPMAGAFGAR